MTTKLMTWTEFVRKHPHTSVDNDKGEPCAECGARPDMLYVWNTGKLCRRCLVEAVTNGAA